MLTSSSHTTKSSKRQAKLFSTFVPLELSLRIGNDTTTIQSSIVAQTTGGEFDYDFIGIFTLAERDGELRVVDLKDFCDPVKRGNLFGWALTTLAVPKA